MLCDLVKTTTSDWVRLDGALHFPPKIAAPRIGLDAVLCLHGVGSNFYGSSLFEGMLPALLPEGIAVLSANTRGRDTAYLAATNRGRRFLGAAFEVVDDCRLDVAAWLDFLVLRGYTRIGLIGHSLGALKAVYSQAHKPHSAVSAVVALSPPRLSYACFREDLNGAGFFAAMASAEEHIAAGRGGELIEVKSPFPMLITAAGYVEKYGPAERYNLLRFVHQLACPALFTYGGQDLETGGVAFAGMPEALRATARPNQPLDIITIAAADHMYTGQVESLATEVVGWLQRRLGIAGT